LPQKEDRRIIIIFSRAHMSVGQFPVLATTSRKKLPARLRKWCRSSYKWTG
jgi:hypothetical protein